MDLNLITQYLPYVLMGLGFGYLITLGTTSSPDSLDRAKHDLEVKKEWIRMVAKQKSNS